MRVLTLAAVLALALSPSAYAAKAARCRDAQGHFTKCPAGSAVAPASTKAGGAPAKGGGAPAKSGGLAMSALGGGAAAGAGGHPVCKKGKPCGNSCIALNKTCHK